MAPIIVLFFPLPWMPAARTASFLIALLSPMRRFTGLLLLVFVLAGCAEIFDARDDAPPPPPPIDADDARRAVEVTPPVRPQPRDRERAAALATQGITKLNQKANPDMAGATRLLEEAARLGDADAQLALATHAALKAAQERDPPVALLWLTRAAAQGNPRAQLALAQEYASGKRVRREPSWADVWFERAARQGNRDAALTLGQRNRDGTGRDADPAAAYRWLTTALRLGVKQVERDRAEMAKQLPSDERQEIDAELAGWRPVTGEVQPDPALIRFVQAELVANGFDAGAADGRLGTRSARALVAFKSTRGEAKPSSEITAASVMALRQAAVDRAPR